jgi:allantoate deiminase
LCALLDLDAADVSTVRPVEAAAWAGEEGSRFPLGCLGSSTFCGVHQVDDVLGLRDARGVALRDALADGACGLLDGVPVREAGNVAAYLELHVEQGPVLEREGIHLGVVTAIAGQRRYRIQVDGTSGHAGTVPMALRADPLCAVSELVLAVESAARQSANGVATIGRMVVEPGGTNVIPASVEFSLDVRSGSVDSIEAIEAAVRAKAAHVERERGVRVRIECLESREPAPMDERMRAAVHRAIASLGERAIDIPSGAGHDAMCLSRIAPTAMIFVPSAGGASHVAQERTDDRDLELGVKALAAAIVEVDRTLG